ncbi:hypothetical protein OH76DRAFT_1424169, partial [Lentinus brumalis]
MPPLLNARAAGQLLSTPPAGTEHAEKNTNSGRGEEPVLVFARWAGRARGRAVPPEPPTNDTHIYSTSIPPACPLHLGMRVRILATTPSWYTAPDEDPESYDTYDTHIIGMVTRVARWKGRKVVLEMANECTINTVKRARIHIPFVPKVTVQLEAEAVPDGQREAQEADLNTFAVVRALPGDAQCGGVSCWMPWRTLVGEGFLWEPMIEDVSERPGIKPGRKPARLHLLANGVTHEEYAGQALNRCRPAPRMSMGLPESCSLQDRVGGEKTNQSKAEEVPETSQRQRPFSNATPVRGGHRPLSDMQRQPLLLPAVDASNATPPPTRPMPARDTQADARRNAIERDASPTRAMASRLPMLGPMHEARSMQSVVLVSSEDDWTPKPRARALPPVEEDGFLTPTPARQPLPCGADEEATTPTLAALPLPVDEADKTLGLLAPYGHPSYAEEEEWQSQPPGLYAALLASPDAPAPLPNTPPLVPGAFTRIKDVDDMRLPPPALPFLHESLSGGVEEAA